MEKLNEKNDQIKKKEKKRIKQFEITREDEPREKQFSILGFTIWRIIISQTDVCINNCILP